MASYPVALTIAGSDSGGGAGIQADLKAMASFGVYGTSVLTAVTAQNTVTVSAVQEVRPDVVEAQIAAVLDDFDIGAVKIGMLASARIVRAVAQGLSGYRGAVVLDPVMVAKSGDSLLRDDAVAALTGELVPRATILTPNLPEAARLLGEKSAESVPERTEQGNALLHLGPSAVLMKGGHAAGAECHDVLVMRGRRAPGLHKRAHRHAPYPRNGLHAVLGDRRLSRARQRAPGGGRGGARLSPRRHPGRRQARSRLRPRSRAPLPLGPPA